MLWYVLMGIIALGGLLWALGPFFDGMRRR
jgi:hypothetical protein